MYNIIKQS